MLIRLVDQHTGKAAWVRVYHESACGLRLDAFHEMPTTPPTPGGDEAEAQVYIEAYEGLLRVHVWHEGNMPGGEAVSTHLLVLKGEDDAG